ncbi:MAG: YggS family pyridoxal phosphate-dependent enzyme [Opitutus sp.]|nr:YggS family pyridoxal phosphate-dependent enzyme [Opitutus sp.]MCS6248137.1 YggS family pyridoxal phosphate-dependent enzyme [Opitutus sp.]MCS6274725.1 YggS family pyridoxal phosphate-dependent enzyme [Opitutus sp.]MCS6277482.1 YggS family pyridoxal phosphate-dependent enzyme [Opitutus sp.]MCS6300600.1 YggS family pyridoxal phosphate-dependent enzyme [Opitutus sp.]
MFPSYESFKQRADTVRAQIAAACLRAGRDPASVELLAVTKTYPAAAADYAARYGLRTVGENRVQEAVEKQPQCTAKIQWELIGHLQSNKAKLAAAHFDRVQSVDSEKLLNQLDAAAAALGKTLPILLQINAGRDPAKFGAEIEDAPRLLAAALGKTHLRVDGLMTIAPLADDPAVAAGTFATLRTLRDDLAARFGVPLRELSMGMSGDLELAILAGSTQVRVGSALYGSRS